MCCNENLIVWWRTRDYTSVYWVFINCSICASKKERYWLLKRHIAGGQGSNQWLGSSVARIVKRRTRRRAERMISMRFVIDLLKHCLKLRRGDLCQTSMQTVSRRVSTQVRSPREEVRKTIILIDLYNGHVISFITRHKGLGVSNKYSVYPAFLR